MLNQNIFGRYIDGDSIVHKLDPRLKMLMNLFFVIFTTYIQSISTFVIAALFTLFFIVLTKIPVNIYVNGLKPIWFLTVLTFILQIIFNPTLAGLNTGFFTSSRFIFSMLITTAVISTTTTSQIAQAINWFLSPLKVFKVPVDKISLMIVIAIQFVPILSEELNTIIYAQKSRGLNFNQGSIWHRLKNFLPILIPLLVNSINKAVQLADVMVIKGYKDNQPRTQFRPLKFRLRDLLFLIFFIGYLYLLINAKL